MQLHNTWGMINYKVSADIEYAREISAQYSLSADRDRVLSEEVINALTAAHFQRHFVPKIYGGKEGSFGDLSQKIMMVATGCPSAAWCAVIHAVTGRMAAYLPVLAQKEIWKNGPDVRMSASFRSTGNVEATDDGWRLSGQWHYLSGIDHAHWALLCIDTKDDVNESRFAAVPLGDWDVQNDWDTLGMRGTGSRSIILKGVNVPTYMTFVCSDLNVGYSQYAQGPQYEASPIGADPQLFMSCALGAGWYCLEQWREILEKRSISNELAIAYSSASVALDTCYLLLENSCRLTDQGGLSPLQVACNARDAAFASKLLLKALNRIFRLGGAQAHFNNNHIQKIWRDVQTLTAHIALRPESNFINYANLVLHSKM